MKNLAAKMLKVMEDVGYIQKSGWNSFHKYRYATEADVASSVSGALIKNGVHVFHSVIDRECLQFKTAKGRDSFLITVKLELTFIDVDSDEKFVGTFYGDASDSDDKAIYKAITGGVKYALMKSFMIETGDDPERDAKAEKDSVVTQVDLNKKLSESRQALKLAAHSGLSSLKEAWEGLDGYSQGVLKDEKDAFKKIAQSANDALEGSAQEAA